MSSVKVNDSKESAQKPEKVSPTNFGRTAVFMLATLAIGGTSNQQNEKNKEGLDPVPACAMQHKMDSASTRNKGIAQPEQNSILICRTLPKKMLMSTGNASLTQEQLVRYLNHSDSVVSSAIRQAHSNPKSCIIVEGFNGNAKLWHSATRLSSQVTNLYSAENEIDRIRKVLSLTSASKDNSSLNLLRPNLRLAVEAINNDKLFVFGVENANDLTVRQAVNDLRSSHGINNFIIVTAGALGSSEKTQTPLETRDDVIFTISDDPVYDSLINELEKR